MSEGLNPPAGILHEFRLFLTYAKLNLMSTLEYRTGILVVITNVATNILIWYGYWSVILRNTTGSFAGWGAKELVIWYAFTEIAVGGLGFTAGTLSMMFYIVEEGMETHLARPYNAMVALMGEALQVSFILRSVIGLIILTGGITFFGLWSLIPLIMIGLLVVFLGVWGINAMYGTLASLAFFIGESEFLVLLFSDLEINFIRLPGNVLPRQLLQTVFVGLPLGLLATLPALMVFGQVEPLQLSVAALAMAVMWSFIANYTFGRGLQRYEGVGE